MTEILPIASSLSGPGAQDRNQTVLATARKLESGFLAEMLKSTGLGEQENSFSGSAGADQFASFHRTAIAERMVETGGIGLTEVFYRSMMEQINE